MELSAQLVDLCVSAAEDEGVDLEGGGQGEKKADGRVRASTG